MNRGYIRILHRLVPSTIEYSYLGEKHVARGTKRRNFNRFDGVETIRRRQSSTRRATRIHDDDDDDDARDADADADGDDANDDDASNARPHDDSRDDSTTDDGSRGAGTRRGTTTRDADGARDAKERVSTRALVVALVSRANRASARARRRDAADIAQ